VAAQTDLETLAAESLRLLEGWLYQGTVKLASGREVTCAEADEQGLLRLAMDLSKRVATKRRMSINPDSLRPKATAVEGKGEASQAPQVS